ncbi:MAG: JAB domain-containing protein [Hungatella sp.]|jgi:DNA repair protein RadC|nr:JAB domain-containing protein [Hungatella sp.]
MKDITKKYESDFIQELSALTDISHKVFVDYAEAHPKNVLNILEHPECLNIEPLQIEKLNLLNNFLSSYSMVKFYNMKNKITISCPKEAGKYFTSLLANQKEREVFMAAYLNSHSDIIETDIVSEGGLNYSLIDLRIMLKKALNLDAAQLIVAHCHPSGSLKPSKEDLTVTNRIRDIFEPLSIKLLDHIIVGGWDYLSLSEGGYLDGENRKKNIPYYGEQLKISESIKKIFCCLNLNRNILWKWMMNWR